MSIRIPFLMLCVFFAVPSHGFFEARLSTEQSPPTHEQRWVKYIADFAKASAIGPIINEFGDQKYWIKLDEAKVQALSAEAKSRAQAALERRPSIDSSFSWHRPTVQVIVGEMEDEYGIRAVMMTSYIDYTFAAFMPSHLAERLALDPRVSEITPVSRTVSDFSSWSDYTTSGEKVPWGKQAIGTDDTNTTSNIVYFLDGVAMLNGGTSTNSELNIVGRSSVNSNYECPGDPYYPCRGNPYHANHVAGILGADLNSSLVRGVNDYAPLINVYVGQANDDTEIANAMDWALYEAEVNRSHFAVANMSLSGARYAPNGAINGYLRRLSTRLLVVESAGNARSSACSYAYGPTSNVDGILVVGGIDSDGSWAAPYDNTGWGGQYESGTNYSSGCIEVWGPSKDIYSTTETSGTWRVMHGTSMAAPHVSALAARYGGTSTRPVERESYIRSHLFATGYLDETSATIYVPSYTQSASFTIPGYLSISSAIADATLSGTSTDAVYDGLYLSGLWNAGHSGSAWIELDLGSSKTLKSIRLTPEMTPSGSASHSMYVGGSSGGTQTCSGSGMSLVATISGTAIKTLEPLVASFSSSGRYVRVCTTSNDSWTAWREIEVYGY